MAIITMTPPTLKIEFKTTLIDFYGYCGAVDDALNIFNNVIADKCKAREFGTIGKISSKSFI